MSGHIFEAQLNSNPTRIVLGYRAAVAAGLGDYVGESGLLLLTKEGIFQVEMPGKPGGNPLV